MQNGSESANESQLGVGNLQSISCRTTVIDIWLNCYLVSSRPFGKLGSTFCAPKFGRSFDEGHMQASITKFLYVVPYTVFML